MSEQTEVTLEDVYRLAEQMRDEMRENARSLKGMPSLEARMTLMESRIRSLESRVDRIERKASD